MLLIRVNGFRRAEVQYRLDVANELAAAFTRRLRNALPPDTVIGRWSYEEFLAILKVSKSDAMSSGKRLGDQLSGAYSCLLDGKAVRATIQLSIAVVDGVQIHRRGFWRKSERSSSAPLKAQLPRRRRSRQPSPPGVLR